MTGSSTISSEHFQNGHVTVLAAIDNIEQKLPDLQAPYNQGLLYTLRRRLYKIEKTTTSLSLTLLPLLAFEMEAMLGELADSGSTNLNEEVAMPLLQQGLQQITLGMQALACGKQEASAKNIPKISILINNLRNQRGVESIDSELNPSKTTVPASDDELEKFERSLQAMQQELKEVVSNKSSEKTGWLNRVVDSIKTPK